MKLRDEFICKGVHFIIYKKDQASVTIANPFNAIEEKNCEMITKIYHDAVIPHSMVYCDK